MTKTAGQIRLSVALVMLLAIYLVALGADVAMAASPGPDLLPAPAWELLKSLPWPGALVATLFSPVGRALAGLIVAMTPGKPATNKPAAETTAKDEEVAEALRDLAAAVKHSNEIHQQTVQVLGQVKEGLAILLDRTRRGGGD